jgi:hypothetical protein
VLDRPTRRLLVKYAHRLWTADFGPGPDGRVTEGATGRLWLIEPHRIDRAQFPKAFELKI